MPMISTSVLLFSLSFLPKTSCIDYSGATLVAALTCTLPGTSKLNS